ncbi:MAG: AI-2E family transporter [Candidatus Dadabacteria bacterium]|nr:MAG: AI-2E family transporter [Candidatus Dadabacteria bacterium]
MILLDRRGRGPSDADAVASHRGGHFLAICVLDAQVHCLGIGGSKAENVPDFDAARAVEHARTARAAIALSRAGDLGNEIGSEIARRFDMQQMRFRGICTGRGIVHPHRIRVAHESHGFGFSYRSKVAWLNAKHVCNPFRIGQLQPRRAQCSAQAGRFDIPITTHASHDQAIRRLKDKTLDQSSWLKMQVCGHILDGLLTGGRDLFRHFGSRGHFVRRFTPEFRALDICRVAARRAEQDFILARIGKDHKFVRRAAANRSCVRFDGPPVETATIEDATVRIVHTLVRLIEARVVCVETVGILHDKLPSAHQTKPRTHLVTKFRMDLVQVQRQLSVAGDVAAHKVDDDFLVCRTQDEVTTVAVLEAKQLRPKFVPSSAFLPQFCGLNDRQDDFQCAGPVHFLAYDLFYAPQHACACRQQVIDARGQLPDHAGAQHQPVADDLSFFRVLSQCGEQVVRQSHPRRPFPVRRQRGAGAPQQSYYERSECVTRTGANSIWCATLPQLSQYDWNSTATPEIPLTTSAHGSRESALRRPAFYLYFVATAALLVWILRPFLTTLLVAAVLAVWLRPMYVRLARRFRKPDLLAILLTASVVLLILVPLGWILTHTLLQVHNVAANVAEVVANPARLSWLNPLMERFTELTGIPFRDLPDQIRMHLGQGAGTIVSIVGRGAREVLGATAAVSLNAFILLFALYTFLRSGDLIIAKAHRISPLDDDLEAELFDIFRGFSYGIVLGGFVTATLQGIVAGLGYMLFGVKDAFFWGTLTALFSFVPFIGTAMIWVPLAIGIWVKTGAAGAALGLGAYSVLLTGSIDNFVKPWLIGQNSALHPLWLFLSIFGGLLTIGAAGVLIGPVTASFFLSLAEVFIKEQAGETAVSADESSEDAESGSETPMETG